MPFLQERKPLPGVDATPVELMLEEAWGEIWRGARQDGSRVFIVAYSTEEGDELFEESAAALEAWKRSQGMSCPHFLPVLEIHGGAIPMVIVEDPGGPTLRQRVLDAEAPELTPKQQGTMALHVARALMEAETYNAGPLGLSPDVIVACPEDRDAPWKVLPVAPGTARVYTYLAGGRYAAPELATTGRPNAIHPDTFAVACLWFESFRKDFESPAGHVGDAIPYDGLRFQIENGLVAKNGEYKEPNMFVIGIEQWVRKQADIDFGDYEKKKKRAKRGALVNFFLDNQVFFKWGVAVLAFLGGAYGGYWYVATYRPFQAPLSERNETMVYETYLNALAAEDSMGALSLTSGHATGATEDLFERFAELRERHGPAATVRLESRRAGFGNRRDVETTVVDRAGAPVALLSLVVTQRSDGRWIISNVYFRPLV